MKNTKIDWADSTWNPVTGCLHGCKYCYARKIANRFGGASETHCNECVGTECQWLTEGTGKIHDLNEPIYDIDRGHNAPYPYEFDPTFHRYRLNEPSKIKKPQTIFVCSMADLFGEWVPEKWIKAVFDACKSAPQHRYLFLTKNPKLYAGAWINDEIGNREFRKQSYFGVSATNQLMVNEAIDFTGEMRMGTKTFLSIEPIQERIEIPENALDVYGWINWVIIGAETGNRKGKIIPERSWIEDIVTECQNHNIPVFMKESLRQLMGKDFIQEFPWRCRYGTNN